jgi:glyoxylase-like metal-dependent hydrolase (beta-lactamase superfamily II)
MLNTQEVAEKVHIIDNNLYSIPRWGSVYLLNEEKKVLIDTGPTTTVNTVLDGIREIGVNPEDIDYIVITHIHLDHAGGAGTLVRSMPKARVVVHNKGFRHLVNPAILVQSVMAVQGEESMARFGEVVPIDEKRLVPVKDGDTIKLSDRQQIQCIDAPGHAPHELVIHETRNHGLFTGDAAGIYLPENDILLPATPPPNFDAEIFINTIRWLMSINADRMYFAHFGVSDKVHENLELAIDKIKSWEKMVDAAVTDGKFNGVADKMITRGYTELEPVRENKLLYKYLAEISVHMSVAGYLRYYQEKRKAKLMEV